MFKKNIIFFVFLAVIASHTVFSQSVSTEDKMDYKNDGLILYKDAVVYNDDYTSGERVTMGVLNMFFGLGSLLRGHKSGYLITTLDIIGIGFIVIGSTNQFTSKEDRWNINTGETHTETVKKDNTIDPDLRKNIVTIGALAVGGGIILGYLLPLSYHKHGATKVSKDNFPFNIELTTARNGEINGLRVSFIHQLL